MDLLPQCLDILQCRAFWESEEKPTLRKFLEFRLSAGDLKEKATEYSRYKDELNTISRYYAEASEFGQKVVELKRLFKASLLVYWISLE
ncbi:hypothetical protein BC936DRAFT_139896 [Jimgerdemannia flammicorona]|uniref:Uncharacterized protein n=1 Tax=Jimgerdemannia flammicorona TaxID=994334 RepID=A0A433B905_9FUNG|nr:hypothetical protein BC936DRAFT_139896 [Jimgerdemannia flammicorona]